jgi:hypothetical protein
MLPGSASSMLWASAHGFAEAVSVTDPMQPSTQTNTLPGTVLWVSWIVLGGVLAEDVSGPAEPASTSSAPKGWTGMDQHPRYLKAVRDITDSYRLALHRIMVRPPWR